MRTSSRTASGFLAVTLAAVLAAGVAMVSSGSTPSTTARSTALTVQESAVGRPIPGGFVGLSMEFRGLASYAGQDPRAPNPVFEQLLRNLAPAQRPVLRIGGDGTDWTWWPVRHVPRPPGVKYDLTRTWLGVGRSLAQAIGARMIVGVNLEANSRTVAAAEASALLNGIGRRSIEALEIGNEPELYGSFSWYKAPDGHHVTGRPRGYDFSAFLQDFSKMAGSLPRVPLAGPSAGSPNWIAQLPHFLAAEPRVGVVTLHRYPLKHCAKTSHVSIRDLLSDGAAKGLADSVAHYVAVAHARRLPLRIDEINAISCGGVRGVSDTFASALWALDALFQMARVGVDGVNFHTVPRTINELISSDLIGGRWQSRVHPQYYGMMMFAQAAPQGSRLLQITGTTPPGVHTWATRAPDGHVRVVLINKDAARAQVVNVRVPAMHGPATLERLQAPNVRATSGVTLGGQSFGAKTTTGLLAGTTSTTPLTSVAGSYVVRLPAASAALLTLSAQ